jgi:hypothetical protein
MQHCHRHAGAITPYEAGALLSRRGLPIQQKRICRCCLRKNEGIRELVMSSGIFGSFSFSLEGDLTVARVDTYFFQICFARFSPVTVISKTIIFRESNGMMLKCKVIGSSTSHYIPHPDVTHVSTTNDRYRRR